MNVGDPKKAAVLGAVALVVVGVAVFQALPKGAPKAAPAPTAADAPEQAGSAPATVSNVVAKPLQADPFAHPSLKAANTAEAGTEAAGAQDSKNPKNPDARAADSNKPKIYPPQHPPEWGGNKAEWEWYESATLGNGKIPEVKPGTVPFDPRAGEITGENRESVQIDKKVDIALIGTVSVDKPKALLSVDGKEAKAYKTGETVASLGKIVRITENEVVIERDGKKHVVQVGKQVKL